MLCAADAAQSFQDKWRLFYTVKSIYLHMSSLYREESKLGQFPPSRSLQAEIHPRDWGDYAVKSTSVCDQARSKGQPRAEGKGQGELRCWWRPLQVGIR